MGTVSTSRATRVLRRWSTAAGIALAVLTVFDLSSGAALAPVLAASALVYLGAAAVHRRQAAWLVFFGTFVVITVVKVTAVDVDPTWIFLGAAVLITVAGLVYGGVRPAHGLPLQVLAMAVFGAAAAIALSVDPRVGGYLVAAGLLGHAGWDVHTTVPGGRSPGRSPSSASCWTPCSRWPSSW
jgi:hypothetical protein